MMDKRWDHTTDVLVVGSGGGGMTAALMAKDRGADALVIEKSGLYGGSTAMSGGAIWIPNTHLMRKAGLSDSPEEALTYLKAVTAGKVSDGRLRAYVKTAPEMVSYLEEKSHVRFQIVPGYSDYYPGLAGGKPGGGRTIEAVPFDVRKLGKTLAELRPVPHQARVFGRMMATAYDAHRLLDSSMLGRMRAARVFALYLLNPFRLGLSAWELFSHKLCRWLVPFAMIGALVSSMALSIGSPFYAGLAILQGLYYAAAIWALSVTKTPGGVLRIVSFSVLVNFSILHAWFDTVRGRGAVVWEPSRR